MDAKIISEVATDKATAIANVVSYNDALNSLDSFASKVREDMLRTLSMARAWFAVQRSGKWFLAPAKFAGFVGMTPEAYAEQRIGISGTKADQALKRFSGDNPVSQDHPAFLALLALADRFGCKPNSLAYVNVLHQEAETEQEAPLPILVASAIDAVVALAANLPVEGMKALKRRVAAL